MAADRLQRQRIESRLDVFFTGDLGNVGNNPVAFNGQNGSMRVGVRFDAPFTRRLERNDYRSVLIQYQFQRRQLYQYQDGVNFTLRNLLRTLQQLQINLEIQRRAMVIAIRRVDKTREDLNEPPPPTLPGQPVQLLGPTVAQNLIFALNDLLSSQNVFMSVILNHYENRMLLYRELGIMELDDCGIWIDKPIKESEWLTEDQCPMPPSVPQEWMKEAGVDATALREFGERQSKAAEGDESTEASPAEADARFGRAGGSVQRPRVHIAQKLTPFWPKPAPHTRVVQPKAPLERLVTPGLVDEKPGGPYTLRRGTVEE